MEKKKKNTKKEKIQKVKKEGYFKGVINEMKKVHWPDKKYIVKYTIVTISLVLFLSLFFYLITLAVSVVKVGI